MGFDSDEATGLGEGWKIGGNAVTREWWVTVVGDGLWSKPETRFPKMVVSVGVQVGLRTSVLGNHSGVIAGVAENYKNLLRWR